MAMRQSKKMMFIIDSKDALVMSRDKLVEVCFISFLAGLLTLMNADMQFGILDYAGLVQSLETDFYSYIA